MSKQSNNDFEVVEQDANFKTLFPATIFVEKNTMEQQYEHLKSEVKEFEREWLALTKDDLSPSDVGMSRIGFLPEFLELVNNASPERVIEELYDMMHSAETLARKFAKEKGVDVDKVQQRIVSKNNERRYYE